MARYRQSNPYRTDVRLLDATDLIATQRDYGEGDLEYMKSAISHLETVTSRLIDLMVDAGTINEQELQTILCDSSIEILPENR